ncbi:MAG: acyl-CoA dehydrogenase [Burkholderia sp.]|nr:acyl-CoA dehydrogenase [Burkholderia sp.]
MLRYTPPLKDIHFVLTVLLDAPATLAGFPAFSDIDDALMQQVIREAGRFGSEVLFPLNAVGDREGARFEDGAVRTPAGFGEAYRQFREGGWPGLSCVPEDGGQGLPQLLECVVYEILNSANHGWTMYPALVHGAYACLKRHANEELKARYLPKIASGEWLPTMCLTEPDAGSDLGRGRTKAVPHDEGSYRISGTKIFISGGEHDLTDNIVHLVLARLPDGVPGSKGISLFLVPKFLPDGERNEVHCAGIEHKMGLRGSATCTMQFNAATGWLVGEPHRGLAAMFVMMNAARLLVGIQGLAHAETAYQNALAYSRERLQMRAVNRPAGRENEPADPIVMHPAVQRLLMTQRAGIEGGRMLAYWTGLLLDTAEHHGDAAERAAANEQLALITPVVKTILTDQGCQGASQALQVFGGHGFISETGIEQYSRDVRITTIYEGTNEIQAIDFLMRKVLSDGGARLNAFLAQIEWTARDGPQCGFEAKVLGLTQRVRGVMQAIAKAQPEFAYRIAGEALRLAGHCALAWLWLRAARIAAERRADDPVFLDAKRDTARYYFTYVLPEVEQLFAVIGGCLQGSEADETRFPADLLAGL